MITNLTLIFPGSQEITILSFVRQGNYHVSENTFQIMLKTGISKFDFLQNPSFLDHFKRRSENR